MLKQVSIVCATLYYHYHIVKFFYVRALSGNPNDAQTQGACRPD